MMLKLELMISNEAAAATAAEIEQFLSFESGRLIGGVDGAPLGYVVMRQLLGKLRDHQEELERAENARVRSCYPSIRERRGIRR
jgi:hypothetical protein